MSKWSIPLERLATQSGERLETVARKATLDIFRQVIERSPVDTGRFKGNWNVSFGVPRYTIGGRVDKSPLRTIDGGSTAEITRTQSLPVGGLTYLSNGLPYGSELEFGSSRQAPGGMVRISARNFEQSVRRALR